jgi:uncharacterized protein (UPF0276 family)
MHFPGKEHLPTLGVGLSFRTEIADAIYRNLEELDFVELILDNELIGGLDSMFWQKIAGTVPVVAHAVNSSLGTLEPLDVEYLRQVAGVRSRLRSAWFSEHLAFTRSEGVDVEQLVPVQFSERNAAFIADKIASCGRLLECPFLIENIAYYFTVPGSTLSEIEFLLRVLEQGRCGLLLDVNNLYANSINHDFDPYAFIDRLPEALVVELHVAGGEMRDGLYVDTHGHAINSDVMALVDYAVATKNPHAILLEREKNYPPMEDLVGELSELRRIWKRHRGRAPGQVRRERDRVRA